MSVEDLKNDASSEDAFGEVVARGGGKRRRARLRRRAFLFGNRHFLIVAA